MQGVSWQRQVLCRVLCAEQQEWYCGWCVGHSKRWQVVSAHCKVPSVDVLFLGGERQVACGSAVQSPGLLLLQLQQGLCDKCRASITSVRGTCHTGPAAAGAGAGQTGTTTSTLVLLLVLVACLDMPPSRDCFHQGFAGHNTRRGSLRTSRNCCRASHQHPPPLPLCPTCAAYNPCHAHLMLT
jgi:hypothetical protein